MVRKVDDEIAEEPVVANDYPEIQQNSDPSGVPWISPGASSIPLLADPAFWEIWEASYPTATQTTVGVGDDRRDPSVTPEQEVSTVVSNDWIFNAPKEGILFEPSIVWTIPEEPFVVEPTPVFSPPPPVIPPPPVAALLGGGSETSGKDDAMASVTDIFETIGGFIPGADIFDVGVGIYNAAQGRAAPQVAVPTTNTGTGTVSQIPNPPNTPPAVMDTRKHYCLKFVNGEWKWVKKHRRRRKRLATPSDIKDLSALKGVLGNGKILETWIATHG